ncbi:hypothetical protein HPB52_020233 [Rhipicephalus sanguineus]|uniref:Lysosomal acid phosphatase n=1 Tax=Rhipicephalus sanguineus TaxID=34632 RepID=A0A9D4PPA3_RHISA|nr:hypothetical protein HPB52_020233 [Rhipicephalus sanguineus]
MSASSSASPKQLHGVPDNLLYVFVISRHGQRTPIARCQNLPKKEPVDYGQLTAKGREQTFKLGQYLRDRYDAFLRGSDSPGHSMWEDLLWADQTVFAQILVGYERPFAAYILGHVLDALAEKFEERVKGPDRMHVFSMSDTSLFSVLKLLNESHDVRPCFCASILIEVYKDGNVNRVRVLYRAEDEPCLVPTNKVENPCELSEFLEFLRGILNTP